MNIKNIKEPYNTDSWLKEVYEQIVCLDSQHYVFIEMNIKQFRYINARYGYSFGNQVLQKILTLLIEVIDEGFVSHRYADTFDILIPYDFTKLDIRPLLMRIVDQLFNIDMPEIYKNIFASFGIYYLKDYPNFKLLKTNATIARKSEKTLLKRTFSYETINKPGVDILSKYMKEHELECRLTHARFHHEFKIYIQPKVEAKTHKICGGEVLSRLILEDGTEISPSTFIPILKENGEMYMIDIYQFETMCHLLKERQIYHKRNVPISFNVTNRTLFNENFIEEYTNIYEKYLPDKNLIEFEFLEDIHYEQHGNVMSVLHYLKHQGFTCSLDDFGNGFASFHVLLNGNIDIVKLDRMFFTGELDDEKRQILHDIIHIAKIRKIKVLAEGIETKEYADFVEAEGCDYIQGFYYYKPMPLEDFYDLLDKNPNV